MHILLGYLAFWHVFQQRRVFLIHTGLAFHLKASHTDAISQYEQRPLLGKNQRVRNWQDESGNSQCVF